MGIKLNYNQNPYTTLDDLRNHQPQNEYFVGIDSDGTVFDSMEIKHKDCFIGSLIRVFELALITHEVHVVWNYVNIHSINRGTNRFKALLLTFNYLREINRVQELGIYIPKLQVLKNWVDTSASLSNDALIKLIDSVPQEEESDLKIVLKWSEEVNRVVKTTVFNLPPMPGAIMAMKNLKIHADLFVISNTPTDTLYREWNDNNIMSNIILIGGQETGTKTEMLKCVAKNKYAQDKILIIGDSPGDLSAAKNINALFFPIMPSSEMQSWNNFHQEYCNDFINGNYAPDKEAKLIEEFQSSLKSSPSWTD